MNIKRYFSKPLIDLQNYDSYYKTINAQSPFKRFVTTLAHFMIVAVGIEIIILSLILLVAIG